MSHSASSLVVPVLALCMLVVAPASGHASATSAWWPVPMGTPPPAEPPASPGARVSHSMIFDPVSGRTVLFGGSNSATTPTEYYNDVWTLASGDAEWQQFAPSGTPPTARQQHAAVLDTRRHRMVVFSGGGASPVADVWALSLDGGGEWTQLAPTGVAPSARHGHSAVYDSTRDRIVLFGGASPAPSAEIWLLWLDGTPRWELMTTAGGPVPRYRHAALFDAARDRMLVFGGTRVIDLSDLWILDFSGTPSWSVLSSNALPGALAGAGSAHDRAGDQWLISGGGGGTGAIPQWSMSLSTFIWTNQSLGGGTNPGALTALATAWDAQAGALVLHGGQGSSGPLDQTWTFVPSPSPTWTLRLDPSPPAPPAYELAVQMYGGTMTFDVPGNRFLLFGGWGHVMGEAAAELQIGRDSIWVPRPDMAPPFGGRLGATLDFDASRSRWLLFGGFGVDDVSHNDLWEFRPTPAPQWLPLSAGARPPARSYHASIFDPLRDRLIVFGGDPDGPWYSETAVPQFDDLWQLDLSAQPLIWTPMSAVGTPPVGRSRHRAVYDPVGDRVIVYGGADSTHSFGDVWELSLTGTPTWTSLIPSGTQPASRFGHTLLLDANRGRLLVFGGFSNDVFPWDQNDLWELMLSGGPLAWRLLEPSGSMPDARRDHAAAYDPVNDRVVIAGGANSYGGNPYDTWRLQFGDAPTATMATLLGVEATSSTVSLRWDAHGNQDLEARVERREESGGWSVLRRATVPGSGLVDYRDATVRPGARLVYRLVVVDGGREMPTAEVWIEVPGAERFALEGFRPNPSPAGARVAFSVDRTGSVEIDLLDVSGRRVGGREIAVGAPGSMVVDLAPGARLTPGVYFIRLRSEGRTLVHRGAIAP